MNAALQLVPIATQTAPIEQQIEHLINRAISIDEDSHSALLISVLSTVKTAAAEQYSMAEIVNMLERKITDFEKHLS